MRGRKAGIRFLLSFSLKLGSTWVTLYSSGHDNVWEERLNPSNEHFSQDFVRATQKHDWSLIVESGVVSKLGDESYHAFVDVGQGFPGVQHRCEGFEEHRRDFIYALLEKFHWDAILPGRLTQR